MIAFVLLAVIQPGAAEHAEAERLLAAGEEAVESAFGAITRSEEFAPEDWSDAVPEGNLLLDEAERGAAAAYRRRRAAYRATLGDALAAAGDPAGAAREYRRALDLDPRTATWRRLADLPGLPLAERVDALLRSEAVGLLRASGAFRTEGGLAAALDRFRFEAEPLEGVSPHPGAFPALTLAVEGGAWSSERAFAEGRSLLLYFPGAGCPRCGEVVGDLQLAIRDRPVDLLAAAGDADLPLLTRIAGLTGAGLFRREPQTASERSARTPRPVGHVVRRDTVAFAADEETLWFASRAGLSVWRLDLAPGDSVRRAVGRVFRFLDDSPVPGGTAPLVEIPEEPEGLIEMLRRLEVGGEPLADLEERLLRGVRAALRESPGDAARLLRAAAGLGPGDAARLPLLNALVPRLSEAADGFEVERAVPGGRLRVAAGGDSFGFQREYEGEDGARYTLAAVVEAGELRVLALHPGRPVSVSPGFRFVREHDGESCVFWEPDQEVCSASVRDGAVVVRESQLAGAPGPPFYWRRVDGGPEALEVAALTEGLAEDDREALLRAAAAIGPGSPIESAAVRYNLALAEERLGNREEALEMLLAIGDASFTPLVEAAVRRLYRSP